MQPTGITMSDSDVTISETEAHTVKDWTDLGREMWSYLTGRGASIDYRLVNMVVEVPRDIGPDAPRAVWKFDGTIRITTSDSHGVEAAPREV